MKKIITLLTLLFVATLVLFKPVAVHAATEDEVLLSYVNNARAEKGLRALTIDAELTRAAQIRATECNQKFSHTRPDGTDYYTVSSAVYGENLAKGQSYHSLEEIFEQWMLSPSHRDNILYADSTKTGFGIYRTGDVYFVAEEFN